MIDHPAIPTLHFRIVNEVDQLVQNGSRWWLTSGRQSSEAILLGEKAWTKIESHSERALFLVIEIFWNASMIIIVSPLRRASSFVATQRLQLRM
jgi:hypothetical protein